LAHQLGLGPLFRSLARATPLTLGLGYALSSATATGLYYWGRLEQRELLSSVGALCAVFAVSSLFTIVTWYQNDEVARAAFFLGITTSISKVIAFNVAVVIAAGPNGGSSLLAAGSLFGIPIGILVWSIAFGILISIGRRFRHIVGPDSARGNAPIG